MFNRLNTRGQVMRRREDAKVVFGSVLFVFLLFLGLPGAGYAAPIAAEYEGQLAVKPSVLAGPGRVAVGEDGTFYVSDGYRNQVAVFAGNGAFKQSIPMPNASAVAVAQDGTLYIGSHKDFSVAIVRNGKVAGHLGGGAGEFKSVTDIAVDAGSGNIYVADSVGNAVKVYDSSGKNIGGISNLSVPMGVGIAGREVYILSGHAPVVVYDTAGNFLRSIGESGLGNCQLARPTGIALLNGMVYVSDTGRDAVVVYDGSGACSSEIRASKGEINIPFSLALSGNGILYVTSKQNQGVHAFSVNSGTGAVPGAAGK